jgi:uncharacterized YigZ family protein
MEGSDPKTDQPNPTESVKNFLMFSEEKYRKATHYCYAYSFGLKGELRQYATDAGEPTNSAGPPILAAVKASGLSNVICVVVRYYGGINLGVGGLIRAYGQCARDCLECAEIETRIFFQALRLRVSYEQIGAVVNLCQRLRGNILNIEYDQDVIVHLHIPQRVTEPFQASLKGIGSTIEVLDALTS